MKRLPGISESMTELPEKLLSFSNLTIFVNLLSTKAVIRKLVPYQNYLTISNSFESVHHWLLPTSAVFCRFQMVSDGFSWLISSSQTSSSTFKIMVPKSSELKIENGFLI
jgi:hypothetical protein